MTGRRSNSIGNDGKSFESSDERYSKCCKTVYLGVVYDKAPTNGDYEINSPCYPVQITKDSEGTCAQSTSEPPHGSVMKGLSPMCAKLLILQDAVATDSGVSYAKQQLLLSRKINTLPYQYNDPNDGLEFFESCGSPIQCPPSNKLFSCCNQTVIGDKGGIAHIITQYGGPWKNCEVECPSPVYSGTGVPMPTPGNKCEDNRMQIYSLPLTPCFVEPREYSGGYGEFEIEHFRQLSGYALGENDWWFLSSPEFTGLLTQVASVDPFRNTGIKHSIVLHFSAATRVIRCMRQHHYCDSNPVEASENFHSADCNRSNMRVLGGDNKEEREKNVEITCFVGYTHNLCGMDPQKACEVVYSP